MPALIRSATLDDSSAYLRLVRTTDQVHRDALPKMFREPDPAHRSRDSFKKLLTDPEQVLVVAEREGAVVGFLQGRFQTFDHPLFQPRPTFNIENITVDAAFRRQGIARQLHDFARDLARARGAEEITLVVYAFNEPAARLYRALGYQPVYQRLARPLT